MELTSAQSCTEEEVTAGPPSASAPALHTYSVWLIKRVNPVHAAAPGLLPAALWERNCVVFTRLSESKSNLFTAPLLSSD